MDLVGMGLVDFEACNIGNGWRFGSYRWCVPGSKISLVWWNWFELVDLVWFGGYGLICGTGKIEACNISSRGVESYE